VISGATRDVSCVRIFPFDAPSDFKKRYFSRSLVTFDRSRRTLAQWLSRYLFVHDQRMTLPWNHQSILNEIYFAYGAETFTGVPTARFL
jgi:D-alanyl-lipoteichoic acid acyltransferase DltB (MBOAT superfamily)